MNKLLLILTLFSAVSVFSCTGGDAFKKREISVLILGNSITRHAPAPDLGWYGDWGLAASAPENDFKSLLDRRLKDSHKFSQVQLDAQNISWWENNFAYDLNLYTNINNKKYDLIIVRLGENVNQSLPEFAQYESELNKMIDHFRSPGSKVIITGTIWASVEKDRIHQKVAADHKYYYLSMAQFQADPKNYAYGLFDHPAVSAHPSDYGMATIATMLFDQIMAIY